MLIDHWICHVCKQEMPDDQIAVHSFSTCNEPWCVRNIRYCKYNQACALGALDLETSFKSINIK
jgi:hypothetical protein